MFWCCSEGCWLISRSANGGCSAKYQSYFYLSRTPSLFPRSVRSSYCEGRTGLSLPAFKYVSLTSDRPSETSISLS